MKISSPNRPAWAAAVFLVMFTGANAFAADYTFVNIADDTGTFGPFLDGSTETFPRINDNGTVVFRAVDGGIYTSSGGVHTQIASASDPTWAANGLNEDGVPAINNSGQVSFTGVLATDFEQGVFVGNGGSVTPYALGSSDGFIGFSQATDINASGTVVFKGQPEVPAPNVGAGIFTATGSGITTIADNSGQFENFTFPTINDAGAVAFSAILDDGSSGLYLSDGIAAPTAIADDSGQFSAFLGSSINNAGSVVFDAELSIGGSGIFRYDTLTDTITTIVDTSGLFGFVGLSAINDANDVAFLGFLNSGELGIFTGSDPVADKVIQTGDLLFGSSIVDMRIFSDSLNDSGQIAFSYALADGRSGIAVANIPGPPALLVLGISSVAGVVRRRRC